MIFQGPTPVAFVPTTKSVNANASIDFTGNTISVVVFNAGSPPKFDTQPIPPALLAALQPYVQGRIEIMLGWTGGSVVSVP